MVWTGVRASRGSCTRPPASNRAPGSAGSSTRPPTRCAAAAVMTLLTEPGSNASVTADVAEPRRVVRGHVRVVVRVEPRVARHRVDVARPHVHHDDRARLGAVRLDGLLQRLLRLVLHLAVERGASALMPSIGSFTTSMPCAIGWPALCSNVRSPGTPASSESYSASSPVSPVPSIAHEPDHGRRERPGRVVPLRDREEPDTGQLQVLHALGHGPDPPAAPRTRTSSPRPRAPAGRSFGRSPSASASSSASPAGSVTSAGLA